LFQEEYENRRYENIGEGFDKTFQIKKGMINYLMHYFNIEELTLYLYKNELF
jgi:hypothetical protein